MNEKVAKKSLKLKSWDQILIDELERYLSPIILEEAPKLDIPILKETADYLIINKPKGVLSHPNSIWDIAKPSVVWFLYHHYKNLPSIWNFIRAWLLHRLDKDTDGLMIIAKSEKGLEHFKALFKAKSESEALEEKKAVPLKKWYHATCELTPQGEAFWQRLAKNFLSLLVKRSEQKSLTALLNEGSLKLKKLKKLKIEQSNFSFRFLQVELTKSEFISAITVSLS